MTTRAAGPDLRYTFLTDDAELERWADDARQHDWLAFDTEFIGEKRYKTLVCLIQVANPNGLFLIDPLAVHDLEPFLELIEDERILKITHAGENDYRLLYQNYDCHPRNLVDTQLAAGFLSDQYPVNFKRLAAEHIGVELKKGFAVVDWTKRPIAKDALKYALEDVVYLREMLDATTAKLKDRGRYEWFLEEMKTWEQVDRYEKSVLDEVKQMSSVFKMRREQKLFMLRMVQWRREVAEVRDHSREMVLATKDLNAVARVIRDGRKAINNNRHLKHKSWLKYMPEWEALYAAPATEAELRDVAELSAPEDTDIRQAVVGELFYTYLKYHCLQASIAIDLVVPRSVMRDLRTGDQESLGELTNTWRGKFLGDQILELLAKTEQLEPVMEGPAIHFKEFRAP